MLQTINAVHALFMLDYRELKEGMTYFGGIKVENERGTSQWQEETYRNGDGHAGSKEAGNKAEADCPRDVIVGAQARQCPKRKNE